MSRLLKADPDSVFEAVGNLLPGDKLTLKKGFYSEPVTIFGRRGSQERPIVIGGRKAKFGTKIDFYGYQEDANRLSAAHEAGGSFPGIYFLADNASLVIRDCQWVVIEDLHFENCWPTAVYLDNCQHIVIRRVSFRGGTIAIGAFGPNTRHILIEDCDWVQDTSGHGERDVEEIRANKRIRTDLSPQECKLWSEIDWRRVHGSWRDGDGVVDVKNDARAFDGDFFRAWTIAGYVILRNNIVVDAFNGMHFFNQASSSTKEAFCRNVLVEGNWFVRIRDNAIEPEDFAWNWTIRANNFVDCYMPFSFEMARSGFFYVSGNVGWNLHLPGTENDTHRNGQLFKFPDAHEADGPHYVFNNTWLLRTPIVKKKMFSNLVHANNLIGFVAAASASPLGKGWDIEAFPKSTWDQWRVFEQNCFTRNWRSLEICFDGDLIDHEHYPHVLRSAGYPIGANAKSSKVVFENPGAGSAEGFRIASPPAGILLDLQLPNGERLNVGPHHVVGAWQTSGRMTVANPAFLDYWPSPAGVDTTSVA